mgnify:CR=1 FL=1
MPALEESILEECLKYSGALYPIFVETGTFEGDTIFRMEPRFTELHTIEISENLYCSAKKKYNGDKIHFHLGDSSVVLGELIGDLSSNTVFWLDGHWSGGITGRGKKDCPLYEELEAIATLFKHKAIIIVDDFRLFETNVSEDWSDISLSGAVSRVKHRLLGGGTSPSPYANQDRLLIFLKEL